MRELENAPHSWPEEVQTACLVVAVDLPVGPIDCSCAPLLNASVPNVLACPSQGATEPPLYGGHYTFPGRLLARTWITAHRSAPSGSLPNLVDPKGHASNLLKLVTSRLQGVVDVIRGLLLLPGISAEKINSDARQYEADMYAASTFRFQQRPASIPLPSA